MRGCAVSKRLKRQLCLLVAEWFVFFGFKIGRRVWPVPVIIAFGRLLQEIVDDAERRDGAE